MNQKYEWNPEILVGLYMPLLVLGYYHVRMSISPLSLELESLASGISIKVFGLSALCDHVVKHVYIFQCTRTAATSTL